MSQQKRLTSALFLIRRYAASGRNNDEVSGVIGKLHILADKHAQAVMNHYNAFFDAYTEQ